jgi:hypothetical protein
LRSMKHRVAQQAVREPDPVREIAFCDLRS